MRPGQTRRARFCSRRCIERNRDTKPERKAKLANLTKEWKGRNAEHIRQYQRDYRAARPGKHAAYERARCGFKERVTGPGFIYGVIHPKFPGYTKIGRTVNVNKRLSTYNTGDPKRRYQLAFAVECKDAFATEIEAHQRLDGFRMAGTEWFAVHPTDAHHIIEALVRETK